MIESKVIERKAVLTAFNKYVEHYNMDDPKIQLKYEHTFIVANLAEIIAKDIGANSDIAWLSGILHDVGRFEQITKYQTFSDALSIDHAMLGADLLFKDGLIDNFNLNLSSNSSTIIEKCIRNHNMYRLPEELSDIQKLYCEILRDADKVDIFRVHCDTSLEDIYNVTTKDLRESSISKEVKNCFVQKKAVLKEWRNTPADFIVSLICLYFELIYPISKRIAKKQGYIDSLLAFESDNTNTREWFQYMRNSIWEN